MNEKQLEYIRRRLRNIVTTKFDDDVDTEGILGMMELSKSSGERKVAEEMLEVLPEPECDVVRDYRAICQLIGNIEHEEDRVYDPERQLYRQLSIKREEAKEAIKERIQVEERETDEDHTRYRFRDPVSKLQQDYVQTPKEEEEWGDSFMDRQTEDFVDEILHLGVQRPM